MLLTCSPRAAPETGVGVIQQAWERFAHDHPDLDLKWLGSRETSRTSLLSKSILASRALLHAPGWRSPHLSTVAPAPILCGPRTVAYVHDLRWMVTRGRLARSYRTLDLAHTLATSSTVVCISDATRRAVSAKHPFASSRLLTIPLGADHVPCVSRAGSPRSQRVILIGQAPHKRNEVAARALVERTPHWCDEILAINVSEECERILESAGRHVGVCTLGKIGRDELIGAMSASSVLISLSEVEGFGLPYVEAMRLGLHVIASDVPVAREVLGKSGTLLPRFDDPTRLAESLGSVQVPPLDQDLKVEYLQTWDRHCSSVLNALVASTRERRI